MTLLSNAAKARMLARLLSYVMETNGTPSLRVPLKELDTVSDFGMVVEGDTLVIALGDKNV